MKTVSKVLLILTLFVSVIANAQEIYIDFKDQPKWKQVLKMAKSQNKPIFVDAYTTWCGPCKIMDKEVFTEEHVANYFNTNYISVKMDMEKGEGIKLKDQWEISAFPTLLYFDSEGNITHRVVGAYNAKDFLVYSKMALDEDKMALNLQNRYDAGERGGTFIYNYLVSLRLGYYQELEREVANAYLSNLSNAQLLAKENWSVIRDFMKDPSTKQFQFLVTNIDKLKETNDLDEVNDKFYNTIDKQIQSWSYWYGGRPFETEKEAGLITFLQESNYDKAPALLAKLLANKYRRIDDKVQYLETLDYIVKFNLAGSSSTIVSYANNVMSTFKSESAWAKALNWLKIAEEKETKVEHKAAIFNAKSKVLEKLGNKSEAQLAALSAKKADQQAEDEGTKIHSIPAFKMIDMTPKKDK